MAIKQIFALCYRTHFSMRTQAIAVLCWLSVSIQTQVFSQTSSIPAAFEPQEYEDNNNLIKQTKHHSLGFGVGIITGDASAGREVFMLSTRYAYRVSNNSEIEFSLHYQSTALALSNAFDFAFASAAWNGDITAYTYPFSAWRNLRVGAGISIRRQVATYSVTRTFVSPTGIMQNARFIEYQQPLAAGASCKLDYILFANTQIEAAIRTQGYIYGAPISGENNQAPRGTPGGGVSIELFIRTYF
jgi:hypothetical protein